MRGPRRLAQNAATTLHRTLYKASGGKIGGRMFGADVLLLRTRGRKSGKPRESPLMYLPDGNRMVLVASNGGAPKHPS